MYVVLSCALAVLVAVPLASVLKWTQVTVEFFLSLFFSTFPFFLWSALHKAFRSVRYWNYGNSCLSVVLYLDRGLPWKFACFALINSVLLNHLCVWILFENGSSHHCFRLFYYFIFSAVYRFMSCSHCSPYAWCMPAISYHNPCVFYVRIELAK